MSKHAENLSPEAMRDHLRTIAAGIAVIVVLLGGMVGSMLALVAGGMYSLLDDDIQGDDFGAYVPLVLFLMLISTLAIGAYFLRWYAMYARRVRKDPSQMIEI